MTEPPNADGAPKTHAAPSLVLGTFDLSLYLPALRSDEGPPIARDSISSATWSTFRNDLVALFIHRN